MHCSEFQSLSHTHTDLPPGPQKSVALPSHLSRRSSWRAWTEVHYTTPAKPHCPRCLHGGEYQGWREPSPCISPRVGGPPMSGCSPTYLFPPPPKPLVPAVGRSRPVAPTCWSMFREEWRVHGLVLSLSLPPLRAPVSPPPLFVRAALFPPRTRFVL